MRCRFATLMTAITLTIVLASLSTPTPAQNSALPCDAFMKNSDGSWTAMRNVGVMAGGIRLNIQQGGRFRPGAAIMSMDIATKLDTACPAVSAPPPAAAPAPTSLPTRGSEAALTKFTDANGNIDVQKLTCGQLAEMAPQEADFLLLWYSGWTSGQAKRRPLNLPRVREGIRNVLAYCQENRDKRINQALDTILKEELR